MDEIWIKKEPYVDDRGIWMPVNEYVRKGMASTYRCVLTKDMFVEAYNKWIKNDTNKRSHLFNSQDDADCWCE